VRARGLRIALVTAYPPSRGRLSEYGWHLVQSLAAAARVDRVHVLADTCPGAENSSSGKISVDRCWRYDRPDLPRRVARAIRGRDLDVLWFNLHMTSTSATRVGRFVGLSTPALLHAAGIPTLVTLHNMLGLTDLRQAGVGATQFDVLGARLATILVGRATAVCLLLPEYARLMRERYRARRALYVPLGTPGVPAADDGARDPRAVLAFGRFGTYKRLEDVLESVAVLSRSGPPLHLHVAGSDSVHAPGYLARLQGACGSLANVTFHGYVPEAEVPALFQRSAVALLPYGTIAGVSSVAMQAAMYGTPILATDIPGLRLLAEHGLRMTFYPPGNREAFANTLARLLACPGDRRQDVESNLRYCDAQSLDKVVERYLDLIATLRRA
jgi:glycosyltransferase involved in cell wall biosynthesis